MVSFFVCLFILIGGYFTYGKFVENTFGPDDRETPAVRINDGVDYVVMPEWKLFLVQLLNIAGLGPIFGALTGAEWGPVVFLWITFGTVFAGGVHDYFSGMLSERSDGASISEVTGNYLGLGMKNVMRVFSVVLLIMVGTVFAVGPAGLIVTLIKEGGSANAILTNKEMWLWIILLYYLIATFCPIDKIIGKIYPVFGICLIAMALGVGIGIFTHGYQIPEIFTHFGNEHPTGLPIWSFMFITVACGAISGFHATQSPLMARCMKSEKQGRFVFYGAMVAEGIIALIWAAAGCAIYGGAKLLDAGGGNSTTVYDICKTTMGSLGMVLAMMGVIACPITSGDTAFRSARLTIADWFKIDQNDFDSWSRCSHFSLGLCYCMALFQLDEPDPCHDCALGSVDVSLQGEEELLDYSGSGSIHECGFHDLLLLRTGVSRRYRLDHNRGLPCGNYSGGTFPAPLYESNKAAVQFRYSRS